MFRPNILLSYLAFSFVFLAVPASEYSTDALVGAAHAPAGKPAAIEATAAAVAPIFSSRAAVPTDDKDRPTAASDEWWAGVQAIVRGEMNFIAPMADAVVGYQAINIDTGLQIHFPPAGGFWVTGAAPQTAAERTDAVDAASPDWRWGVRPQTVRIDDTVHAMSRNGPVAVTENRLVQRYTVAGITLTEWFVNEVSGLRQNFTLYNRPPGPANQPMRLELTSLGNLVPDLDDDGRAIKLRDAAGVVRLVYRDLHIVAADDQVVPGRFVLAANHERLDELAIVVDDTGAAYPLTIASLTASPAFIATGEGTENWFGFSVAGAGDVNDDNYADVVVGASAYGGFTGRVYVFHGGPTGLSASPAFTATGEGVNDEFGAAIAEAGDVNDDGYGDVVIGAQGYSRIHMPEWSEYLGRVYVFHGGPTGLSARPAFTATGQMVDDLFGTSVAGAGDVNDDGFADIIIGADGYSFETGRVYVFHGGPSGLSASPAFTATGETTNNLFGHCVAPAGDVNGDGYADVIVGAPSYDSSKGRVYVYHGGPTGLSAGQGYSATGEATFKSSFGSAVAGAGDVNDDGYADAIIGAPSYAGVGRTYVYHGGPGGLSASPTFTVNGEATGSQFGHAVAGHGDFNDDGYADIIVGAPYYSSHTGQIYAFHGGPGGLSATATFSATGEGQENWFGFEVSSAGDVNSDGYSDVIVGAYGFNDNTGRAYAFHGSPTGLGGDTAPAAANVGWFAVTGEGDHVHLAWQTVNEVGIYGFHLYRGQDAAGPGERITDTPVAALGYGTPEGYEYSFDDLAPRPAEAAVYYWLEELRDDDLPVLHGPERVDAASLRVLLPLIGQ